MTTATTTPKPGARITEDDVVEGLRVTDGARVGTITRDPETQDVFQEGDELGWDEETMGPVGVCVRWDGRSRWPGTTYTAINVLRVADERTVLARLEAAGEDLAESGITLVISKWLLTRGDAWCRAVDEHGPMIAHIHIAGGWWSGGRPFVRDDYRDRAEIALTQLHVSFPHESVATGGRIRDALIAQGLKAGWSGDPYNAVVINI